MLPNLLQLVELVFPIHVAQGTFLSDTIDLGFEIRDADCEGIMLSI